MANVVEDHQPLIGDAVINDGPGLMLIVEKFPWANTVDVTKGVEDAIAELRPGLTDIDIDTAIFRPATFIEQAIDNLTLALLIGCLLVILIIGAFLFEWRTALISVLAIPISLVAAGLVLYWSGAVVNTMILAGLVVAVGVVVDDAIIDVENILRRLRQNRLDGHESFDGTGDPRRLARGPRRDLLRHDHHAGRGRAGVLHRRALGLVLPPADRGLRACGGRVTGRRAHRDARAGADPAPRRTLERRESPVARTLKHGYTAVLSRTIRSPKPAYAMVGVIVALGAAALPFLGQSLLPSFKERDFLMHWLLRPGSGHAEMIRDHRGGQQGAAGNPRRAQLRRARRAGAAGRRTLRHRLHRELDQRLA